MQSAMNQICSLLNPNNTMTINRLLAHAVGIPAAMTYTALIGKYVYYEQNGLLSGDNWFYSTVADLEESTTLGIKAQRSAINTLVESGLIKCEMKGMPALRYFLICDDIEVLCRIIKIGQAKLDKLHENIAAKRNVRKNSKVHHQNGDTETADVSTFNQQIFNVESIENSNSRNLSEEVVSTDMGVFNSQMLNSVESVPCECPSALSSESLGALSRECPTALTRESLGALPCERPKALPCECPSHAKSKDNKLKEKNPKEINPKRSNPKKEKIFPACAADQSNLSYPSAEKGVESEVFNNDGSDRSDRETAGSKKITAADKRQMPADGERPFADILRDLGLDLCVLFNGGDFAKSEDDMRYCNDGERMIRQCVIPDYYCYRPKDLETALRYVTAYSYFCNPEKDYIKPKYIKFHSAFINVLVEMLTEDEYIHPNGRKISRYRLWEKLNHVIKTDRVYDFLNGFRSFWENILDTKEVHNKKKYMKTCLWNYLTDFDFEEFNAEYRFDTIF